MSGKLDLLAPICPYCHRESALVDSVRVYGKSYGMVWLCQNYPKCDSYVGVHDRTSEPLGRMANKELRVAKKMAHAAFDTLWRRKMAKEGCSQREARGKGYVWLAGKMGLTAEKCHIGMFDVDDCKRVLEICRPYLIAGGLIL